MTSFQQISWTSEVKLVLVHQHPTLVSSTSKISVEFGGTLRQMVKVNLNKNLGWKNKCRHGTYQFKAFIIGKPNVSGRAWNPHPVLLGMHGPCKDINCHSTWIRLSYIYIKTTGLRGYLFTTGWGLMKLYQIVGVRGYTVKHFIFARLNFRESGAHGNSRALNFREFVVDLNSTGP